MEMIKMTCSICPNKCQIEAEVEDGEVMDVTGNGCMKGFASAQRFVNDMEENGENA